MELVLLRKRPQDSSKAGMRYKKLVTYQVDDGLHWLTATLYSDREHLASWLIKNLFFLGGLSPT